MEKEVFPHLTPAVMSGDEEDSAYVPPRGLRCKRFIIRSMVWRNPMLIDFCRVLDALYFSLRYLGNDKWSRGHFPDERLRCGRTGPGCPVPGLPQNFYNPTWLATLDPLEIEALDIQPSVDLDFSEDIRRYIASCRFSRFLHLILHNHRTAARFLGIQNRLSKPLPRGHKALETLEGSGPSAQTVANPPPSAATPTRSISVESVGSEPEPRDPHPRSSSNTNTPREPHLLPEQHSPTMLRAVPDPPRLRDSFTVPFSSLPNYTPPGNPFTSSVPPLHNAGQLGPHLSYSPPFQQGIFHVHPNAVAGPSSQAQGVSFPSTSNMYAHPYYYGHHIPDNYAHPSHNQLPSTHIPVHNQVPNLVPHGEKATSKRPNQKGQLKRK